MEQDVNTIEHTEETPSGMEVTSLWQGRNFIVTNRVWAGKTTTLSFWYKNADTGDQWWKYTSTATADENGRSIYDLPFDMPEDKNFPGRAVQIEEGRPATPFEVRPYSEELDGCKRYYNHIIKEKRQPKKLPYYYGNRRF
ncbi:hypothetical protein [Ralstonia phage RP13]|nr:hypothetical protein [Ralstonia phage RP13]